MSLKNKNEGNQQGNSGKQGNRGQRGRVFKHDESKRRVYGNKAVKNPVPGKGNKE